MSEVLIYIRMDDVESYIAQGWRVWRCIGWKGHDRPGFRNFIAVWS